MSGRSTAEIVADLRACGPTSLIGQEAADRLESMFFEIAKLRAAVSFPPHSGSGPDVDPATGDERATTDADGNPL